MTVKSRTDLNTDADTLLADNTSGDISAEDVRQRVKDLADSAFNLTTDAIDDVPGVGTAASADTGIANDNVLLAKNTPNSGEVARFAAAGIEGLTESEFKSAFNLEADTDFVSPTTLASTSNGDGASLVGIEDSGGLIAATTVEGALAEIASDVAALDAAVILKGTWDASAGSFPGAGAAQAGWSYIVSVGGTVDSQVFTANDRIVAIADNASATTYAANWHKLDYTDQVLSVAGLTGAITSSDLATAIESDIESAIDTLANLASIQGVSFTFGAYAATLLNNADEAAFKAAVNLEAGTDFYSIAAADAAFQPKDADLTTLATAFTTASASGAASLKFAEDTDNGSNAVTLQGPASTADVTVTLPAATDTLVGKATTDTLTNKTLTDPAITGAILEDIFTITDGAAFEIDPGNGSLQRVTLGAARTPAATNFANGESVTLMVDDGSAFTITWTTVGVVWVGGSAPTLATSGFTIIELWKEGNVIRGALVGSTAS